MRIEGYQRKRTIVGLTSLIDVIFLLLLFFMLSSTFSRYSQLDLGVAAVGTGGSSPPKLIVQVDAFGPMRLNGQMTLLDDLPKAISVYQEKGVTSAVVIPRGEVSVQKLVLTLENLQKTKLEKVSLAQ